MGMSALTQLLTTIRRENVRGARSRYGDCELVSDEFLSAARKQGLADASSYIVLGYRTFDEPFAKRRNIQDKEAEHQWVVIDGTIYDGTSDQFGDDEVTVTKVGDPRYREHRRMFHTVHKASVARVVRRYRLSPS